MYRIIALLFIYCQIFAQKIEVYDIAIDKTDSIYLPDTIYCLYGTIVESENFNYFEWHIGTMTEKVHYFINDPNIVEVAHKDWDDDNIYYQKHVLFNYILYITDLNIEKYLGATNVIYIDTAGERITWQEHRDRVNLFDENFKIMMEIHEYYKKKNDK